MPNIIDTSIEAEAFQLDLLKRKSPEERLAMVERLSSDVIRASKSAISRLHPEFTAHQISDAYIALHFGAELSEAVRQYRDRLNGLNATI